MKSIKHLRLKLVVSLVAVALAVVHVLRPDIQIDFITVCLLAIAIVPWLQSLFKAVELPGGFKLEFHDLQRIKEEAESSGILASPSTGDPGLEQKAPEPYAFERIDPKSQALALLAFRVELEQILRRIAVKHGKEERRHPSVGSLIRSLAKDEILTAAEVATLQDMIQTLNRAAHGVDYDERTADWVMQVAPRILDGLKNRVETRGGIISHANPNASEHWIDKSFRERKWTSNKEWGESILEHRDLWQKEVRNTYSALLKRLSGEPAELLTKAQENWERQVGLDVQFFASLHSRLQIGREGDFIAAMSRMSRIRERALELEDYLQNLRS